MVYVVEALLVFGAIALPFIAMPLLWRRMKRARAIGYDRKDSRHEQPWEERLDDRHGLGAARSHRPNDALIDLGERAREARWPVDNG